MNGLSIGSAATTPKSAAAGLPEEYDSEYDDDMEMEDKKRGRTTISTRSWTRSHEEDEGSPMKMETDS